MLGSQNRKTESKMAVGKMQRKEKKTHKNGTKENQRTRVRTSGKANSPPG